MKKVLFVGVLVVVILLASFWGVVVNENPENLVTNVRGDTEVLAYLNQRQVWMDQIITEMNKENADIHFIGQRCQAIAEMSYPTEAYEIYYWTSVQCMAMLQVKNCGSNSECVLAQIEILNRASTHLNALKDDFNWQPSQVSYIRSGF